MEQPKIKTYQIECKNYGKTQIENSYSKIYIYIYINDNIVR